MRIGCGQGILNVIRGIWKYVVSVLLWFVRIHVYGLSGLHVAIFCTDLGIKICNFDNDLSNLD